MPPKSELEEALLLQLRAVGIPTPERNYRFHSKRRWEADFAWPDRKLIAEVHGSTWTGGRHVRGQGFQDDRIKMNSATLSGWQVLEFTGDDVNDGWACILLERVFKGDHPGDAWTSKPLVKKKRPPPRRRRRKRRR